ncbi:MAG: STAS domain-containing protein [Candidatus Wallbacteria bacterium]|nr:STAS domain-containing protein [Candidatus Wallbacteria bacterium]
MIPTDFKLVSNPLETSSKVVENRLQEKGIELVKVSGDIDVDSSVLLQEYLEKLLQHRIYKIILDLSEATYINSRGIGVITQYYKLSREKGGGLVMINPSEKIQNILKITFLTKILPVLEDINQALIYFGK